MRKAKGEDYAFLLVTNANITSSGVGYIYRCGNWKRNDDNKLKMPELKGEEKRVHAWCIHCLCIRKQWCLHMQTLVAPDYQDYVYT